MEELLENALFYIIIFFVAVTIIAFIKEQIEKAVRKNSTSTRSTTTPRNDSYKLIDFNDHFALVLDNTLDFVDAYRAELPGEWIFINISTVCEKGEFSTDGYRYYEEFIEFKVNVGCWYDSILYRNKDAKDYMESIYNYNSSDNVFTYRMRIGDSTNCMIPRDIVKKKFFDCLDAYDRKNPNRKLTRTSYGIHHQWNL